MLDIGGRHRSEGLGHGGRSGSGTRVGRKQDIRDVETIAAEFEMDAETRRDFGDYLEECKRSGAGGSRNDRGDFTWQELEQKAREFLELDEPE